LIVDVRNLFVFGIAPYILAVGLAIIMSYFCFFLLAKNRKVNIFRCTIDIIISYVGLFVVARLFSAISRTIVILNRQEAVSLGIIGNLLLDSGFVFYGGLIGFILTFATLSKMRNKKINFDIMDIIAVCIPLFHCIARIGCFLAGCCYGIEHNGFLSIYYSTYTLELAQRIPIQLVESGINFMIFVLLLVLNSKDKLAKRLLPLYLILYSTSRFYLEYFRGDVRRGFVWSFSFSQVISLLIMLFLLVLSIMQKDDLELSTS
jgi:phosphatidylglycerol:prolipoprotein diacylglycerol transferase